MHKGGYCSVVFYVRIGGALMAPFFCGLCIRDLVLCDYMTGGGGRCVVILTFVFFWGKEVGCLWFAISYR